MSNREQRRSGFSGQPEPQLQQMIVKWGVTEDGRVAAIFPKEIQNWLMTPAEADEIIAAIRQGQAEIKRRQEAAAAGASAAIDKAAGG